MRRTLISLLSVSALAAAVSMASAADPQVERQEAMKRVGGAMGALVKMTKGETPFDAAAAKAAFGTMEEVAAGYVALFPEGSETGFETEAAPAIWTDRAGFEAAAAKFEMDAGAAAAADYADLEALRAGFGPVAGNCKACHEDYRIQTN